MSTVRKYGHNLEIIVTKTVILVLDEEEILVWVIPPLLSQPLDPFDRNPTHIPPLFRIAYPDDIVSQDELFAWKTMSHWYFDSSQLYFDILCRDSKVHRFDIIVKPNLCDTSLRLVISEHVPHYFDSATFQTYSICEDTLVACCEGDIPGSWGAYTGLKSSRFSTIIQHGGKPTACKTLFGYIPDAFALCQLASGRYVHLDDHHCTIVVVDLFQ